MTEQIAPAEVSPAPQWIPGECVQCSDIQPLVVDERVRALVEANVSWGVKGKVNALLAEDARQHTVESFNTAITGIAEATRKQNNAVWLELRYVDQINATGETDTLTKTRQVAIIAAAIAENSLAKGTVLNNGNRTEGVNFDKGLDLGAQATIRFRQAAANLIQAENYATAHLGEIIGGRVLSQADVRQLRSCRDAIEMRLEAIYGDHTIIGADGAFSRVRRLFDSTDYMEMQNHQKFASNVTSKARLVDRIAPNDPAFQGKVLRDAALVNLAAADYQMDRGRGDGAKHSFDAAVEFLETARKVDPNHAPGDLRSMQMIVEQLKQRGLK